MSAGPRAVGAAGRADPQGFAKLLETWKKVNGSKMCQENCTVHMNDTLKAKFEYFPPRKCAKQTVAGMNWEVTGDHTSDVSHWTWREKEGSRLEAALGSSQEIWLLTFAQ